MKRQMECSCCGGDAGRFEQWHNRDTGYGVCATCVPFIKNRGGKVWTTDAEFARNYGYPGVHYEAPSAAPSTGN